MIVTEVENLGTEAEGKGIKGGRNIFNFLFGFGSGVS